MPDRATGRRTNKAVMTGDMAGDATDGCALEAALRIGGGAHYSDCKRQGSATQKYLHWQNSVTAVSIRGSGIRSRKWRRQNIARRSPRLAVLFGERLGADLGKRSPRRDCLGIHNPPNHCRLALAP